MSTKIAIIGKGNVGSALQRGLSRTERQIRAVGHDASEVRAAAEWADVVILAVPFAAVDEVVAELGDAVEGKPLIDVMNPLGKNLQLAVGFTTSAAEELQKKLPKARVVKAFNTVFAKHMDDGTVDGEQLSAFVAGDDTSAKRVTIELAKSIGFDAIDAGPLTNARWLEALAFLNIQLGVGVKMGREIGFKLVHHTPRT
jgi:predicted dinucleotide-binding enzyme